MVTTKQFQFSVVSNNVDYDNETNVIEYVEPITKGFDDFNLMEKVVDDLLVNNQIPSGVPQVKGMVSIINGDPILESYVVFNVQEKSFEFGVSLGEIEFVQNFENMTEDESYELLEKLMEKNQFETDEKTFGFINFKSGVNSYFVMTRPYCDDWDWDFDTEDTEVVEIVL
jgi:hypothetical protein